jgi:hypothetical protein
MRQRCQNEHDQAYPRYGGRGISVCERWQHFEAFYQDMGDPPSRLHTIERIDNNGNYAPGNCCWATKEQQARNTRRNVRYELNGEKLLMRELADRFGLLEVTIRKRLAAGATVEEAVRPVPLDGRSRRRLRDLRD